MTERAERLLKLAEEIGLTEKQRLFAEAITADPDENQTKAAIAAGYPVKAAHVRGAECVRNRKIQQYITAIKAETGLTERKGQALEKSIASAEEVLATMTGHLRADMDDCLDEYGSFSLAKLREKGKTSLLKEMVVEEKILKGAEDGPEILERKTKFKLVDSQKAADQLARYHKLYEEQGAGTNAAATLGQLVKVMDAATRMAMAKALLRGQVVEGERIG